MHGGVPKGRLGVPDDAALRAGLANLERHVGNVRRFGIEPVVALNRFATDTEAELDLVAQWCAGRGVAVAVADVWARGGAGGAELAARVLEVLDRGQEAHPLYPLGLGVAEKIETVVRKVYGGAGVEYSVQALRRLAEIQAEGLDGLPVCMAKTQYSFSDNASLLGAPEGFTLHVRDLIPKTGAGFIVVLTGAVMTMPGLPKEPAALRMDVDGGGRVTGLF
jgi:formate--tetrahydrofolate ligase